MKQNRKVSEWRSDRTCRVALAVCMIVAGFAVAAGSVGTARAAMVTVDGTFTSFQSDMFDPTVRATFVNGTPLTSTGTVTGSNGAIDYYASNTVYFPAPTGSVTFTYDPNILLGNGNPPLANSFEFIPNAAPTDVIIGQDFQLGILRVTNGQYYPNTDIGITLTTHSNSLLTAFNNQTFSGTIRYQSISAPDGDPLAEADHFYFLASSGMGIVGDARVFDLYAQPAWNPGNVGEFALHGHIGSLDLAGLVPLSGGFTTSSTGAAVIDPVFPPSPNPARCFFWGVG